MIDKKNQHIFITNKYEKRKKSWDRIFIDDA